ncbi:hypothetical protein BKA69DRAFT_1096483 [Paraphysoderma sedebokerense]|nr:hypothetical protein BKA69DRAFT_1096483 [Paraphysoderma sedebokerense]
MNLSMTSFPYIYLPLTILPLILFSYSRSVLRRSRFNSHRPKANQERVVIIGATSGIGLSTALLYAKRGAKLFLGARRIEKLKEVQEQCRGLGAQCDIGGVDVADNQSVEYFVRKCIEKLSDIDTLIISSGVLSTVPFPELIESPSVLKESIDRCFAINTLGPIYLAQHFLPSLLETKGNIIVVSSVGGKFPAPTRSLYCGSKYALHGFFESLAIEVQRDGVFVCLVSPGTVDGTELRSTAIDKVVAEKKGLKEGTKKGAVTAVDVAKVIARESDQRCNRVVFIPWVYGVVDVVRSFFPALIDGLAAKKYGYQ